MKSALIEITEVRKNQQPHFLRDNKITRIEKVGLQHMADRVNNDNG